jgi:hypothetical protein
MLAPNVIPLSSKDVVRRVESGGVLLFQVQTDEMFFISKGAFSLFELCDGTHTVAEIKGLLIQHQPEFATSQGQANVDEFLESLAEHSLIELWR